MTQWLKALARQIQQPEFTPESTVEGENRLVKSRPAFLCTVACCTSLYTIIEEERDQMSTVPGLSHEADLQASECLLQCLFAGP